SYFDSLSRITRTPPNFTLFPYNDALPISSSIELLDKVLLPPCDQNVFNSPKPLIHQSEALGIGLRDLPAKAHQTTSHRTIDEGIATAKYRQTNQSNRRVIEDNGPGNKQGQC